MSALRFFLWLFCISILCLLIVLGSQYIPYFANTLPFTLVSIAFFLVLTIVVYFMGNAAARSTNDNDLTRLIMGLVFVKLFCCLVLIAIYHKVYLPPNNHYLVLFFIIYLIFTVFEVRLLSRINKLHSNQRKQSE